MTETIRFPAVVYKVQTLADHGIRVYLDLPETHVMQAAMLMECQRMQVVLDVDALPQAQSRSAPDTPDGKKSRPVMKSLRGT